MNENQTHILDVSISALMNEMWAQTGHSPNMKQFGEWSKHYFLNGMDQATQIFRERAPALVESMQDINGDFFDALKQRIEERIEMENVKTSG